MTRLLPLLMLAVAGLAHGHGLEPGALGLQLEGNRLLLVATPPAAALAAFDRDHDGRLSIAELQSQREAIARDLDARLAVSDEEGRRADLTLADVILPGQDKAQAPGPATHVKILRRYRFASAPRALVLTADLASRTGAPLVVMFKADDAPLQSGVLAPSQSRIVFETGSRSGAANGSGNGNVKFNSTGTGSGSGSDEGAVGAIASAVGAGAAAGDGGASDARTGIVLAQWWRIGATHILAGSDHLMFLLLLAWGTPRWREASLWLTAFTLGHSLTLLLVLSGMMLFPAWAEAAIAATIVVTGLERLHRLHYPRPESAGHTHWQAWLAAGFGLVHGLGFAGAVRDTALASAQRWPTLLGFNLGIETGQLLVALALWPLLRQLRRGPEWLAGPLLAGATGLGMVWLVARL